MMVSVLNSMVELIQDKVVAWRRHLHAYPELSFQEEQTSQFVFDLLQSFGNLEVTRPTKTSVMARLIGESPGKVLAIRADMDALPIDEENSVDYASKHPGIMHACGHDGHTAILLGTAYLLSMVKNQIQGEVRFLFQHAEELFPGGAQEMVKAGVMEDVDCVIGAHLWSPVELGKICIESGPRLAAPDSFELTLFGKGGHAAHPHEVIDPIAIGAQVVTNLQHIVSRQVEVLDPAVISVTQFHGGTTHNVIPGEVKLAGTVRTFNKNLREAIPKRMEQLIKGITEAHGATFTFTYQQGYDALNNDEYVVELLREATTELFGSECMVSLKPSMGGEDFSAFLTKAPGAFITIGAGNSSKCYTYPHHHPRFDFDEEALSYGVKIFVQTAMKYLRVKGGTHS